MKTVALIFCLLIAGSMATETETMAQMQAKAADAVDAALQVLYDLRQANVDAQDASDEQNKTQQAACDSEIADLTSIADSNKETGNAATGHRKYLEQEIADTNAYLQWIESRREDIHNRQTELQDQRCYSSQIFVRALKSNSDALEAIQLLRQDLLPAAEKTSTEELLQVKDATSKLAAYKHLFNEQALAEFNQLAAATEREAHEDNDQEGISLDSAENHGEERGILGGGLTDKILELLDKLEADLNETLHTLEVNEVKASWELAVFLQDSEDELIHLDNEEERRNVYLDKTQIALQAAKAHENKAWEIYFQSATALNNAVLECVRKGEAYMADKHKREDENGLLDDVIKQFKEKVAGGLSADTRSRLKF